MGRRKEEVVGKRKESCKVGGRVKEMKMEAGAVHNSFTKQNKVYYVIFLNRYRCHSSHMLLTSTNTWLCHIIFFSILKYHPPCRLHVACTSPQF